ncbi:MAG: Dabb family protein [Clostridia bacterium]|nr:Dabb family protein [Clostridia bacterium]
MVKHIILWNLKDEFSDAAKATIKENAKKALEGLVGEVPGLLDLKLQISCMESSNVDMMLDSTLESAEVLKAYAVHPKHVQAADEFVRPFTSARYCIDYEI